MNKMMERFNILLNSNRYINNLGWAGLEQSIRIIVNFLVSIALVRYLGKDEFGDYSYIVTLFTFIFVFSRFGLNDIVIKLISDSNNEEDRRASLINAIALKFIVSVVFWALASIAGCYVVDNNTYPYYVFITSAVMLQSIDVVEYYRQALVDIKSIVIVKKVQMFISVALKLAFIYLEKDFEWFLVLMFFEVLVLFLGYIYCNLDLFKNKIYTYISLKKIVILVKEVWPIALSNFFMIFYVKLDSVFIYTLLSSSSLGVYAASVRLSESWYFIPTLIATTYFPRVLAARRLGKLDYELSLIKLLRIQLILSIIVGVGTTLIAKHLVHYAYGPEFYDGVYVLIIHIWAGLFISISRVTIKWYIAEGLQMIFLYKSILGVILMALQLYLMIPLVGIVGGAYSLLITLFFIEIIFPIFNKRSRPILKIILHAAGLKRLWSTL